MAYITERKGIWRAQICRRGFRESDTFSTREQAEIWAKNREAQILGSTLFGEVISLSGREMLFLYRRSKERAVARGIEYLLTREQLGELFEKTHGRCSVSGILFNRFRPLNSTKRPWYPSLDRIDSSQPYTPDNCRFVCVAVNVAMGEWGEWALKAMAKAIALNEPVPCDGPEGAPYSFPTISGDLTYRQVVRRRIRARKLENITSCVLTEHAKPL